MRRACCGVNAGMLASNLNRLPALAFPRASTAACMPLLPDMLLHTPHYPPYTTTHHHALHTLRTRTPTPHTYHPTTHPTHPHTTTPPHPHTPRTLHTTTHTLPTHPTTPPHTTPHTTLHTTCYPTHPATPLRMVHQWTVEVWSIRRRSCNPYTHYTTFPTHTTFYITTYHQLQTFYSGHWLLP